MKQFIGKVVSTKMAKTVTVLVNRTWEHPLYKKKVNRRKRYLVDDQIGVKENDLVLIQECRPISKKKKFKVIKVVKK